MTFLNIVLSDKTIHFTQSYGFDIKNINDGFCFVCDLSCNLQVAYSSKNPFTFFMALKH